jgi:hypothetical protein
VGYNSKRHELTVAFLDGSVYRFYNVPQEVYVSLMQAPSHGTYFYWNIRLAFPFERIAG